MSEKNNDNMSFNDLLSGRFLMTKWIRKHIWYILFCVFLSLVSIKNRYKTERILYEISALQREVNILRNRSVSYTVKLQEVGRESIVYERLKQKQIDLELLHNAPIEIKENKD